MKKARIYCLLFTISFSLAYAQKDTTKHNAKKAKPYKQGPSYIDAHLYKIPRPQDTLSDSAYIKKKLNLKTVNKPVYGPVSADCPPDANLALKEGKGVYFEKPHAVAWFTFVAPEDTTLTFDLVPANANDDIDFLLFKYKAGDFINALAMHAIKPVRSNIAKCNLQSGCKTGLSLKGENEYEPQGNYPEYSTPLKIKKGERFYLAVDNYTRSKGHFSLYLHLRWPAPPPINHHHIQPLSNNVKVNILVVDSVGKPVKTRLKIAGVEPHKMIDEKNISSYSLTLRRRQNIVINCIAEGYLLSQSSFTVPDTGMEINDTIQLSAIEKNKNMVLQDIQFEPDQSAFLPEAIEPLSNLLEFMQSNPNVHILIKGYVNDPSSYNSSRYDQNLSEARAKAVMQYLISKGIASNRMEWIGYGNHDMLYPDPQNWEQQQANRRVEIEVK